MHKHFMDILAVPYESGAERAGVVCCKRRCGWRRLRTGPAAVQQPGLGAELAQKIDFVGDVLTRTAATCHTGSSMVLSLA